MGKGNSTYARSATGTRWLVLLVVALAGLFVLPSVASAEYQWRDQFSVLSAGEQPRRVAVEQSTGNSYFVDEGTGRVRVFKSSGVTAEPLTEFGSGELASPFGIAIDESGAQTEIYISDAGTNSIVRYVSDGAPIPSFEADATYTSPAQGTEADQIQDFSAPLALAPNGDLWVADSGANELKRFDDTGAHVAGSNIDGSTSDTGAFTNLLDVATNSEGDLYVVDASGPGELGKEEVTSRVERFAADGSHEAKLGPLGFRNRSATVAVNPANDQVVVSGDEDAVMNDPQAIRTRLFLFGSDNAPIEEPTLNADYTQGGSIRGLAFSGSTRNPIYVAVGRAWYLYEEWKEEAGWPSLHVLSEVVLPTATIEPAGEVSSDVATISGEVDPKGLETEWQVEYKRAAAAAWTATDAGSAGDGEGGAAISREIDGLLPGTQYEARIKATSAEGPVESGIITFTTEAAAPNIIAQSVRPGTSAATLRARINSGGEETTYHFEYGSTTSYGQSTPPEAIPAGTAGTNVTAQISGLTPGATYYFRVVAENDAGDAVGPDRQFSALGSATDPCANAQYRTGSEMQLTDCRAYELVTPLGAQADLRAAGGPATPDGNTVCFNAEDVLVDASPNGIKTADDGYCATRGADGWKTEWATGPAPERKIYARGANVYFVSPDGQRVVFTSDAPILSPDFLPPTGSAAGWNLRSYLWDRNETRELTPPQPPLVIPGFGEFFVRDAEEKRILAVDAEVTRGLFQSSLKLLPEDTNFAKDVYEWNPDGLRVVSANSDGEAVGGTVGRDYELEQSTAAPGSMSADGSRIFFEHSGVPLDDDAEASEAPEAVKSVYLREGDELTLVSPRRGSGPDADVRFMGASSDGEIAYLQTTQQLTPEPKESGAAIYSYALATDQLELIADRPGGVYLLGNSDDGSTVVFRGETGKGAFVLRDGEVTLLGRLNATDLNLPQRLGSRRGDQRSLRITADGSVVVFAAAGEFAGSTDGLVQVYRWSEQDGLRNISDAGPTGPSGNASIGAYPSIMPGDPREAFLHNHTNKAQDGRVISDDGSRVFFETPDALVDRDVNGVTDVYEWHNGEVNLVSPGTGGRSLYHESSADGKTVFFTSFNRVDPAVDTNDNRDLYVAQPGGGFPPPAAAPDCQGDGCQPDRPPPAASVPASRAVREGNVIAAPRVALGKKQLKQLARKGRTTIRVRVMAPGRVTALLKARIKGRNATVAKASKKAKRAGAIGLRLKLSKKARKQLRQKGKLRVKLEVRHSRTDETARKAVMLRG